MTRVDKAARRRKYLAERDKRLRPDQAAALPSLPLCCPARSTSTTAASDANPASHPLPGVATIDQSLLAILVNE